MPKQQKNKDPHFRYFERLMAEPGVYPERVQIMRTGTWDHPAYGDIVIDGVSLQQFKDNFDNNVRRVKIAIDAEHYPEKGAAAWFKELVIEGEKLFAAVEWTDWGKEVIDKKLFMYISPDYAEKYTDDETGAKFNNVLYGAALTNRPFLKGMEPVLMSENFGENVTAFNPYTFRTRKESKGGVEAMKELVTLLGLKEGADEAQIKNAVEGLLGTQKGLAEIRTTLKLKEDADVATILAEIGKIGKQKPPEGTVMLSEAEVKTLRDQAAQGADALKQLKESKADALVEKALNEGKIVPKQKAWAKQQALNDPKAFAEFVENAEPVVGFKENGSQRKKDDDDIDVNNEQQFREAVSAETDRILSEGKITNYREAVQLAEKNVREKNGKKQG